MTQTRPWYLLSLFWIALIVALPRHVVAETSIKRQVLENCEEAKQALAVESIEQRPALVQYLIEVLHLKLGDLLPPETSPHLISKLPESNPARMDSARIDPFRAVDPDDERKARRCAVDLLGIVGAPAITALPELVRYGTQNELDDASRNGAERAAIAISEQSAGVTPREVIRGLVALLDAERIEFIRSIFLIMAKDQGAAILDDLIANQDIAVNFAALAAQDIAKSSPVSALQVFAGRLKGDLSMVRRTLSIMRLLHAGDSSFASVYVELLGTGDTALARELIGLLRESSAECSPTEVNFQPLATLVTRTDEIGDAALAVLRCFAGKQRIDLAVESIPVTGALATERVRASEVLPFTSLPSRVQLHLIDNLINDQDGLVQSAAISALGVMAGTARDEVSSILLRRMRPKAVNAHVKEFAPYAQAIIRQLPKLTPVPLRSSWVSVIEDFAVQISTRKGLEPFKENEKLEWVAAIKALGGSIVEIPIRLLRHEASSDRYLGLQLLIASSIQEAKYQTLVFSTLGDESEVVRSLALRSVVAERAQFASAIKGAIKSKNSKERGAAILLGLGEGPLKQAEMRTARDWLSSASCQDLFLILSDPVSRFVELQNAIQPRVSACIQDPAVSGEVVVNALSILKLDQGKLAEIADLLAGNKLSDSVTQGLLLKSAYVGLNSETTKRLLSGVVEGGNRAKIIPVLPAIVALGVDAKEFVPSIKTMAKATVDSERARCQLFGALSTLDVESVDWRDLFKDEVGNEEGNTISCASYLQPQVAQSSLVALAHDAPIRKRAAFLERLAQIRGLLPDEGLSHEVASGLAAENREVRCQATMVAIGAGIGNEEVVGAIRGGLYGDCWARLRGVAKDEVVAYAARQIAQSPRNNLEVVRSSELLNPAGEIFSAGALGKAQIVVGK